MSATRGAVALSAAIERKQPHLPHYVVVPGAAGARGRPERSPA